MMRILGKRNNSSLFIIASLILTRKESVNAFYQYHYRTHHIAPVVIGQTFSPVRVSAPLSSWDFPRAHCSGRGLQRCRRLAPLKYREHDEEDTETTMLKVGTRTPPGFDMKEAVSQMTQRKSGVNTPLIQALLKNQGLILVAATLSSAISLAFTDGLGIISPEQLGDLLHWTGGTAAQSFTTSVAIGVAGAIPIILLGNVVENSDNRAFANVNFSTIMMVMTLFGRKTAPPEEFVPQELKGVTWPTTSWPEVLVQSFILSGVTGFCEEWVFRCQVPALLQHYWFGENVALALLLQALLFGLGHVAPKTSLAENAIVGGLQAVNGLLFGLIYIFSGGNIISCMVAHLVYDFTVFFKTWWDSTAQIEYADTMYLEPLPANVEKEVQRILSSLPVTMDRKMFNKIKRLFFTFDFDKNKTLSLSEVRKGVSYMALERAATLPPQAQVDALFAKCVETRNQEGIEEDPNRLRFPDFVRMTTSMVSGAQLKSA